MTTIEYYLEKLLGLLGSRKFWVMAFAAAISFGLDISPEMQALVILVATSIFSIGTAVEDSARWKGGVTINQPVLDASEPEVLSE